MRGCMLEGIFILLVVILVRYLSGVVIFFDFWLPLSDVEDLGVLVLVNGEPTSLAVGYFDCGLVPHYFSGGVIGV